MWALLVDLASGLLQFIGLVEHRRAADEMDAERPADDPESTDGEADPRSSRCRASTRSRRLLTSLSSSEESPRSRGRPARRRSASDRMGRDAVDRGPSRVRGLG